MSILTSSWTSDGMKILPHGNAKTAGANQYTRTSQKILEREITFLIEEHFVQESYDLLIKESGGPYALSSQLREPLNKRQLLNVTLRKLKKREPNDVDDVGDDRSSLLRDLKSMHVVDSIIVKKQVFFTFPWRDKLKM